MRWNDGQVGERPFAALDLHAFRRNEFQQMADRRGKHVLPALVVVTMAREAAQYTRDIVRDGGLFSDDQFFGHGRRRLQKGERRRSGSSPREAQNDKSNRNAKQETAIRSAVRDATPREARPSDTGSQPGILMYLAFFAVGKQLVQDQRVDVASPRPQDHENDHLQLVQTHYFVGQSHHALDDEFAQQRREDPGAFEKRDEPPALQRELGELVRGISAKGESRIERLRRAVIGGAREQVQPVERVVDVVVLESGRMQLALERILIGVGPGLVVIFEEVNEYVEHSRSILRRCVGINLRGGSLFFLP